MSPDVTERSAKPFLTVLVPCYNEERRLGATLERIGAYLDERRIDAEILVVDDGSSDGTNRIASSFMRGRRGRVLRNDENRGKGYSVRRGALEAAGRWILITDADLSTPIEEYEKLAEVVRSRDLDVAIGSRGLAESRIEIRQNALRELMGKTFNRIIRLVTGLPYRDTQCGFKLLDRRRTAPLFRKMVVDRFAFDVELLFLCRRYGLGAVEVPVIWRNSPHSTVSVIRDPMNMLVDIVRVRWRFRRGFYHPETEATT